MSPKVFFQNRVVDAKRPQISVFDHGFLYGDGIYETVRAYGYQVFHWPNHFKRLKQSAAQIYLKCPWTSRFLLQAIQQVLRANRAPEASVRISISRGPGPLGLDPTLCPKPTLTILLHPKRELDLWRKKGVSIGIPEIRRNHPRCLDPQIKSNNSLNTILAKIEGTRLGVFETVLLNLDDFLTEGTTSNIFFVKQGKLYTPALSCGLLEGVTRNAVMALAVKTGISVHEGRYRVNDLQKADEIFLCSTTLEVMPVTRVRWQRRSFAVGSGKPGPLTQELSEALRATIEKKL